jgi:hypothetical protein
MLTMERSLNKSYQNTTSADEVESLVNPSSRSSNDDAVVEEDDRGSRSGARSSSRWWQVLGGAALVMGLVLFVRAAAAPAGFPGSQQQQDSFTKRNEDAFLVEMEGRKHAKSSSSSSTTSKCDDGSYSKRTLAFAYEMPFAALFKDTKGQSRYEASSVIIVGDYAYAVCDNSWAISKFATKLEPFSTKNVQVGNPFGWAGAGEEVGNSGFESLLYDDGYFYILRESVEQKHKEHHDYHAVIEQLSMGEQDYTVVQTCSSDFEFEGISKGFEGAVGVRDLNNELVILGLCEGNHCSEKRKFDRGNGRLVAMRRTMDDTTGACVWSTIRTINVPKTAFFDDYSDVAMDAKGRVAITTQEDSQLWVGQMQGLDVATGLWNIDAMEFDTHVGTTYDFPKNDECKTQYCNIEGIEWLNEQMVVAVSDKMKGKGKQDFVCFDKDQSVHVFVLP